MKELIKNILLKLKNSEIKKSIMLACIISIVIPLALPLLSNFIFGIDPPKHTIGWSLNYDSQKFIFAEVSIAELSLLSIIIRFIPFIIFGYMNGLGFKKIFVKKPIIGNAYLSVSSTIFYLVIIVPMFEFFIFLDSIKLIRFIFDITDAFNF